VEVAAPSSLPFLPASAATPYSAAFLGGAKYSPTGLPLADLAPLRYNRDNVAGDRNSTGSSSSSSSSNSTGGSSGSELEMEVEEMLINRVNTTINAAVSSSSAAIWRNVPLMPCYLEPNNHVFLSCAGAGEGVEEGGLLEVVTGLIEKAFDSCKVDFLFKAEKCKWKAARHKAFGSVDFRCRVYREGGQGGREGGLVVEFQKRQGDYFLMREAFERFLTGAEQAGLVQPGSNSSSSSSSHHSHTNSSSKHAAFASTGLLHHLGGSGSGAPPASFGRSVAVSTTSSSTHAHAFSMTMSSSTGSTQAFASSFSSSSSTTTTLLPTLPHPSSTPTPSLAPALAPLLDMATGDCRKARLEGVLGLAKLSASEDNRAVLKEAGAIPILVSLVKHTKSGLEPALRQAAVTALSNLSESASCKNPLVEAGVVSSLLRLAEERTGTAALAGGVGRAGFYSSPTATSSSFSSSASTALYLELETRRESARTLANLSEDHASMMVREVGREGIKQFLRSVDGMGDERLRMHARRFKSRMGQEVC